MPAAAASSPYVFFPALFSGSGVASAAAGSRSTGVSYGDRGSLLSTRGSGVRGALLGAQSPSPVCTPLSRCASSPNRVLRGRCGCGDSAAKPLSRFVSGVGQLCLTASASASGTSSTAGSARVGDRLKSLTAGDRLLSMAGASLSSLSSPRTGSLHLGSAAEKTSGL